LRMKEAKVSVKCDAPVLLDAKSVHFLAIKYKVTGTTGKVTVYCDPNLGSDPGKALASYTVTDTSELTFKQIAFQNVGSTGAIDIGDIRVGSSYAAVAPYTLIEPEPANAFPNGNCSQNFIEEYFNNYYASARRAGGWYYLVDINQTGACKMVDSSETGGLTIPGTAANRRAIKVDTANNNIWLENCFPTVKNAMYKLSFYSTVELREKQFFKSMGMVESACRNQNENGLDCAAVCGTADKHKDQGNLYSGDTVVVNREKQRGELAGWYQYTVYFKALEAKSHFQFAARKNSNNLPASDQIFYLADFYLAQVNEIPLYDLIPSASFEDDWMNPSTAAWKTTSWKTSGADRVKLPDDLPAPDGGDYAMRHLGNFYDYSQLAQVNLTPGTRYALTYYSSGTNKYVKVTPASTGMGNISDTDGREMNIKHYSQKLAGPFSGWKRCTVKFTAPATDNGKISISTKDLRGDGYVYLDDLELSLADLPQEQKPLTITEGEDYYLAVNASEYAGGARYIKVEFNPYDFDLSRFSSLLTDLEATQKTEKNGLQYLGSSAGDGIIYFKVSTNLDPNNLNPNQVMNGILNVIPVQAKRTGEANVEMFWSEKSQQ